MKTISPVRFAFLQRAHDAGGARFACCKYAIEFPAVRAENLLGFVEGGFRSRSAVFLRGNDLDAREVGDSSEKTTFATLSALAARRVPQHNDVAFSVEPSRHFVRGNGASTLVIRRHVADDDVFVRQAAVKDDDGNARVLCLFDRRDKRLGIERSDADRINSLRDEILYNADLAFTIAFLQRALPVDLDTQLLGGVVCALMHRLPELVRSALGDYSDLQDLAARRLRGTLVGGRLTTHQRESRQQSGQRYRTCNSHRTLPTKLYSEMNARFAALKLRESQHSMRLAPKQRRHARL